VTGNQTLPDPDELRTFLKQKLPEYMLPAVFIGLVELPHTPNGKIDRKALARLKIEAPVGPAGDTLPATDIERTLAAIWSEILEITPIGQGANFFSLGGHSLMAARMLALVREQYRIELPLSAIFEYPTLAGLARRVAEAGLAADGRPQEELSLAKKIRMLGL